MRPAPAGDLRSASFDELATTTLYAILKLRSEVFVVEQDCVYLDIDGLDPAPDTRHLWIERAGEVAAYVRILDINGTPRIGRVVTAAAARGTGLAGRLIAEALNVIGDRPSVLNAQAHLGDYYAKFGYEQNGPEFDEDGIPHIPMVRAAPQPAR
ncbi:GNAT family N-acetyltransferase [Paractinoplanes globisporus]|uniref:GNAT family N-acetyltransferase n=1 Tax=Paractinoplanes globisporus TaxID=113565 RepID=A0ABW6WLV4_9ACTN|nr:GNAT family N-acetyltransferase [Actinoplanes globisporus]